MNAVELKGINLVREIFRCHEFGTDVVIIYLLLKSPNSPLAGI